MASIELLNRIIEMAESIKKESQEFLQDWKYEVKNILSPEKYTIAEKWLDMIWKIRSLDGDTFLELKEALKQKSSFITEN